MKRKIIIYTGGFELPDKNAAAQRVLANAKILRDIGYRVLLVGIDKTLPQGSPVERTYQTVEGFECWSTPYPKTQREWIGYLTSIYTIEHLVRHNDPEHIEAILCYNYPAVGLYKIRRLCRKHDILFIPDTTEWYESSGGSLLFNTIKWADTTLRMRILQPSADGLITTSPYLTRFYKNNITLELPTLYDTAQRQSLDLCDDKDETTEHHVRLMYAGSAFNPNRLKKNKTTIKDRLDKIIVLLSEVYKKRQNFMFDIYGLTQENYLSVFPEHKPLIDTMRDAVVFHGRRPHRDILAAIIQSDFTMFIRDKVRVIEAGFPSKFAESISYGTPVISNMLSNIRKYAKEGENHILLEEGDIPRQIDTMIRVLDMPKQRRQYMKRLCLQSELFDYRRYIEPTKTFFQTLRKG